MRVIALLLAMGVVCIITVSCATTGNGKPAGEERKAVQEKPASLPKEVEENLLGLLADGKFGEAADKAKEALKTAPRSATANYVLGKSLLSIEGADMQEAENALIISCRATGWKNAQYIKVLADAYERNGKLDGALKALEEAAKLAPDDVSIRSRLEELKKKIGEESSAEMPQSSDVPVKRQRVIKR
jgi:tetratricopeptide (TPR) repeat protein